ncbi:hypothetical protein [Pseudonocardia endophytica]|uniref:Uncharacterized protein n=1 Tax=Pseudonocardia endophytica TaxID=401976 RepID=A0A4R1HVE1_PSEEN|nr:hypothetical protein [Pseudonocardia endophytica]TCK24660.1 hypothetical protein EV378_0443 [Pseudonocardia endophytica]
MRRPITPRLHGALDYGFLALNLTILRLLRLPRRARTIFGAFGLVQGGLNALHDQPLAVRRAVPFATHGTVERNSLPVFVGLPLLAGSLHERRTLRYFLAAGATLVTVYSLTDWSARR